MSTKPTITKLYRTSLPSESYVIGIKNKESQYWKTYTVKAENLEKAFPYNFFKAQYEYHIKPLEEKNSHRYTFLDDVTEESINKMKLDGLIPAIVVETRPQNFQLWLRFENPMTYQQALATSRYLTAKYSADKGAISTSHFSRCPYFKRVLEDGSVFEAKLVEKSQVINKNIPDELIKPEKEMSYKDAVLSYLQKNYDKNPNTKSPLMNDLDNRCRSYIYNLVNKGYDDKSTVDFIVMAWLYRDGYSKGSIISTMLENSPNLVERKGNINNAQRYLEHTYAKVELKSFDLAQNENTVSPQ